MLIYKITIYHNGINIKFIFNYKMLIILSVIDTCDIENELDTLINEIDENKSIRYNEWIMGNEYTFSFSTMDNNEIIKLENFLDNKKVRYNIMIYEDNKKYPSSIRINKKGQKVITKKQTKIGCF
jgi:hypothetical protein